MACNKGFVWEDWYFKTLKCADDNIHIFQKKIVRHNGHQGYRYLEGSFWKTVQTLSNREFFQFYFLWFIKVPWWLPAAAQWGSAVPWVGNNSSGVESAHLLHPGHHLPHNTRQKVSLEYFRNGTGCDATPWLLNSWLSPAPNWIITALLQHCSPAVYGEVSTWRRTSWKWLVCLVHIFESLKLIYARIYKLNKSLSLLYIDINGCLLDETLSENI